MVSINIDKGNQSMGGKDAGVAGNIANGRQADDPPQYIILTRTYRHPHPIQTNEQGHIWLIVGTDSGFEGQTALYYKNIVVKLSKC